MSEIPEGWFEKPLGNLAEPRRGITYSAAMLEAEEGGLPYVNMKSFIKGGGFNRDGTKSYAGFHTLGDLVGERDLLIANTDVTAGDIVGVPALLPEHLASSSVLYSHHVTRLRLNDEVTVPFLYYLLCLPEYRSQMLRIARGTTVLMLDMQAIKRVSIRAPKLDTTQRRITKILSTVDEAMEQTEALVAKLQQMKAGLMHDLFTRGVTPDGHLRPTRQEAPHLYHQTPLGWLPKEWKVPPFRSVLSAKLQNGYFKKPELVGRGYKLVNVSELYQPFGIDTEHEDVERVEASPAEFQKYGVAIGDLFFTRSSLVLTGIAQCNVMLNLLEPTLFECHVIRARLDTKENDPAFMGLYFQTAWARRELMARAKHTTMTTISQPDILGVPVFQPPRDEQERISKCVAISMAAIRAEEASLAKLRQQKQGLMQDLLTGRVRVSTK